MIQLEVPERHFRPAGGLNQRVDRRWPKLAGATLIALLMGVTAAPALAPTTSWSDLRRPLHLPEVARDEPCPVSPVDERVDWEETGIFGGSGTGRGPAYPGLGGASGNVYAYPPPEDGWYGGKVYWYVKPEHRGKVLVRGSRLDGPGALRFVERTPRPTTELRIGPGDSVPGSSPPGSRGVPSGTLFKAEGCYGYQIDGRGFSRDVVFRTVIGQQ